MYSVLMMLCVSCASAPVSGTIVRERSVPVELRVAAPLHARALSGRIEALRVPRPSGDRKAFALSVFDRRTSRAWWSMTFVDERPASLVEAAQQYADGFLFAEANGQLVGFYLVADAVIVRASSVKAESAEKAATLAVADAQKELVSASVYIYLAPGDTARIGIEDALGFTFVSRPLHDPMWVFTLIDATYDHGWRVRIKNGRGEIGTIMLDESFAVIQPVKP